MQTPQFIQDEYGTKRWYLHDKLHREDGPAVEDADGAKYWYLHGERHREDGPAEEYPDGTKYWYLNGKELERFPLSLSKKKVGDLIFIRKQPAIITHISYFVKVFVNNQEVAYLSPT